MHVAGKPLAYGRGSDWGPRCSSRIRIASISTPRHLKAMAASSASVATETKAAIERSLRPVQDRSISQSPWHCGWITRKPIPSAETGFASPWTAAFHPGNQATCTDRRSSGCRLARMRALPPESHSKAAAGCAVSPVACAYLRISEYANWPGGAMRHQVRGQDHARQRGSQGEDRIDGVAVFAMQQRKHALEAFGRADVLILIGARRAVDYDGLDTERAQPVDAGFGIARALRGIDFVGDFVENRHGLALVNTALTWLLRYDDR